MYQNKMFNGLNDAIRAAARRANTPRFEVRDVAPQTVAEMFQAYSETGRIVVWSGGSESTIYRDASVNYLFRAWHDWTHLKTGADFSLAGEIYNCRAQAQPVGSELAKLLQVEIVEQAKFFFRTGDFPKDQVLFTIETLKNFR